MFKLPVALSPQPSLHELADFLEWDAWINGRSSARSANAALDRIDDNDQHTGCDDSSDESSEQLEEVFGEIEDRLNSCGEGYPFEIDNSGYGLRYVGLPSEPRHIVYQFLLLATRMNMKTGKKQAGFDGTTLFEELSAEVIRNYLGNFRARSLVFGTAEGNRFEGKIDSLCKTLGEGGGFMQWDTGSAPKIVKI